VNTNEQIALVALNNMFKKGHMDICVIRTVANILKVIPEKDTFDQLRALHCVDWSDMPRSLYNEIPNMIKTCLGGTTTHRFILADDQPEILNAVVSERGGTKQFGCPAEKKPLLSRWLTG